MSLVSVSRPILCTVVPYAFAGHSPKLHHHNPDSHSDLHINFNMISYSVIKIFPKSQLKKFPQAPLNIEVSCQYTLRRLCDCCGWKTASKPGLAQQRHTRAADTPCRT